MKSLVNDDQTAHHVLRSIYWPAMETIDETSPAGAIDDAFVGHPSTGPGSERAVPTLQDAS
jgi:hypothetical protein